MSGSPKRSCIDSETYLTTPTTSSPGGTPVTTSASSQLSLNFANVRRRSLKGPRCDDCPEGPFTRSVGGYGPARSDLVIIGEHPGESECITGRPFTGPSGMLLNQTLKSYGIEPSECYRTNVVMCACKPKNSHLDSCYGRLQDDVRSRRPKLILTLGTVAFQGVCRTKAKLSDVDGTLWWQPDLGCWVIPTWHPAAVLRGGAEYKFFPRIAN